MKLPANSKIQFSGDLFCSPWYHFALAIRKSAARLDALEAQRREETAKPCPGNQAGQ